MRSEDREMFVHAEREWRILQRLHGHPNIVKGIEYLPEEKRGLSYLVMEQVFGSSLLSYVQDHRRNSRWIQDESLAKIIISQVLSAVLFMHDRGVVHRDMNPTNVFVNFAQD